MAYNNKVIKRDQRQNPVPQVFNPVTDDYEALTGKDGAQYVTFKEPQEVKLSGSNVEDVTLQNAVSAVGNGTVFVVGNNKTVTLEITGTSNSRTIIFEGASVSGAYYPIQGVKLQDLSMATQTTGKDEVWQFEVTGLVSFRARVSAISGGNVTVKGKAVA